MVELRVLGPVELRRDVDQVKLGRAKERSLLGILALSSGRLVAVRTIIQALWDDQPPEHARKNLQIYVSRLRRSLRDGGASARIVTKQDSYGFYPEDVVVDFLQFKSLLSAGRSAQREGRLNDAADCMYKAVDLWSGSPVADLNSVWMEQRREELENYDRTAGYQALCDVEIERGNHLSVLQILDEVIEEHELDSKYISQRMTALDGCGHYLEYNAYWRQVYRRNVESFGTPPPRELQEHNSRLLEQRGGSTSTGSVPSHSTRVRPAQLPPLATQFVGRREEFAKLEAVLSRSRLSSPTGPLIVALTGLVGVGKTELALQWAYSIREQFPDGQLYANLAGYSHSDPADPSQVVADFLEALGTSLDIVPTTLSARTAFLRSVLDEKRIIVVLDDARDSNQVRPLLPAGSNCVLIVTGRHRLTDLVTRNGAYRLVVPPLSLLESATLMRRLLENSDASIDEDLIKVLSSVSGGIPRAVRTLAEMAPLDVSVTASDLLGVGEDEGQTLYGSFMSSYLSLSDSAAQLFRFLGLHPGLDFATYFAAMLVEGEREEVRQSLDSLTSLNLVDVSGARFKLHPMAHAFAEKCSHVTDSEDIRKSALLRILGWYLAMACNVDTALSPSRGEEANSPTSSSPEFSISADAIEWVTVERHNIARVVAVAAKMGFAHGWKILRHLRRYIARESPPSDWLTVHAVALAAALKSRDRGSEGRVPVVPIRPGSATFTNYAGHDQIGRPAMYARSTGPRHGARPERRRRTAGALGIAGVAALVITACTSPDATTSDLSTTAQSTSDQTNKAPMSVTAAELAGRKAMDSYKAMWLNMAKAAETADWQSPLLSEYATGAALTTMSRGLYANHTEGRVGRGRPTLSPTVASAEPPDDPTRVWISDCGDSTNWLYYDAATGALVDDVPGGRRAISAVVDKQADGTWAVSDFAVQELGTC